MAATRIVDPRLFIVEAALIDWATEARERGIRLPNARSVVALRWHVNAAAGNPRPPKEPESGIGPKEPVDDAGIGLPTGPFTVWRRPSISAGNEKPIKFTEKSTFSVDGTLVLFEEPVAMVRLTVSSQIGGPIHGLANAPDSWSVATTSHAPAGSGMQVEMHGPYINGLLVPVFVNLTAVVGIPVAEYEQQPGWERVEIVGLPVSAVGWAGIGSHATKQGPVGALTSPKVAAKGRIGRGTPPIGWDPQVMPGVAAPLWKAPSPAKLVAEVNKDLIPALHGVLKAPQTQQAGMVTGIDPGPPTTLDGQPMQLKPADKTSASISPVMVLCAAAASDPFLSLALGFGTNLDEESTARVTPFHDGSKWDFMITAPYAHGLGDFSSQPVELVAYALRPVRALPPPAPAQLTAEQTAKLAPRHADDDWLASSDVNWVRPVTSGLVRVASFAAARHNPGTTTSTALMLARLSGGHEPIAPGLGGEDPQQNLVHFTDRALVIPNNPGTRAVRYSIATQTLFSLWSGWRSADMVAEQPKTTPPHVVTARMVATPPEQVLSKVCTGVLTVDIAFDWTDRRPAKLVLSGRMFASPDQATGPPIATPGAFLERKLPGAQPMAPAITLTFTGDEAKVSGGAATLTYLNAAGDKAVASGSAQELGVRRYRLEIPGFTADFTMTPHIGIALWARVKERRSPGHLTDWAGPLIVYTSDPVAPIVTPDLVPFASLPDSEGRSHARLSWQAAPGAAGYSIYSSDESTLLAHYDQPEPALAASLTDRADVLVELWNKRPDRRPFTRLTARPLAASTLSLDVVLPKGATGIHAYVVISTSPGSVEGPWPSLADDDRAKQIILRAMPTIAVPATPMLEATAKVDGKVALRITPRNGHRVGRVDIHRVRVDDAARSLDTMGQPIACVALHWTIDDLTPKLVSIAPGSSSATAVPGWTVTTDGAGTALQFDLDDVPGPSWRRVWYRTVVWADRTWALKNKGFLHDIGEDGLLAGRSAPSNAVSVVTPPAGDPDLSALTVSWPGGALADVQIDWSTLAPLGPSPLGPHKLEVLVRALSTIDVPTGGDLISYSGDLAATATTAPAAGDGMWRTAAGPPGATTFRAVVRRSSADVVLDVVVRVADPLGRIAERTLRVPAGSVIPAPEFADVSVTNVGTGVVLSFTSAAPAGLFGGLPYVLKVVALQPVGSVPIPPPPNPPPPPEPPPAIASGATSTRAGALSPSSKVPVQAALASAQPASTPPAGPSSTTQKQGGGGQQPQPQPPPIVHTLVTAIGDIPAGGILLNVALQAHRNGTGRRRAFAVFARDKISLFTATITAPDGRSFSADVPVPGP